MSDKQLTLSIIIPAYNEENHLTACLESIASQTVKPNEVIVVDNNSTDKTVEIALGFPFVKLIKEEKQGISNAHHKGFGFATSENIARIDADSILPNNWVERINDFYNTQNTDVVLTGSGYFKNLRLRWLTKFVVDSLFISTRILLGHYSVWGPNCVIPKTAWNKIANNTCTEKPTLYDDFDIALHLHEKHVKIVWMSSLRVGVRLKHLSSPIKFWKYVARWPGTLRNHGDKRWIIAQAGAIISYIIEYPLLWSLQIRNMKT